MERNERYHEEDADRENGEKRSIETLKDEEESGECGDRQEECARVCHRITPATLRQHRGDLQRMKQYRILRLADSPSLVPIKCHHPVLIGNFCPEVPLGETVVVERWEN